MKSKHFFALLLAVILVFSLSACGGGKAESSSKTDTSEPAAEPASDAATDSAPAEASNANELDYASEEMQEVSSERASEETLVSTYHDWFNGELDAAAQKELTYEDFVAQIGCEASWYNAWGDYRVYTWEADGAPSVKVGATFEEVDGAWKCKYFNGNNIGAT